MATDRGRSRKRIRKNITAGVAHVRASFNNTMINITDAQGNTIAWSSAGLVGFKGSRKSTPFAAQVAAEDAGRKAQEHGVTTLEVEVLGLARGENLHSGHCRRSDSPLHPYGKLHPSLTMVADRPSGGGSEANTPLRTLSASMHGAPR